MIRVAVFHEDKFKPQLQQFFSREKRYTPQYYNADTNYRHRFVKSMPHVILTVCDRWDIHFPQLSGLEAFMKRKWLHYDNPKQIKSHIIANTNINEVMCNDETHPLISIFTSSYKSKSRIMKAYKSLQDQTYKDWEWVIVDDTCQLDESNFQMLLELAQTDYRIRVIRPDKNSGMIGEVKRLAAMACTGFLLVELDHDDILVPHALETLVKVGKENPDIDFFHSNWCEPFEEDITQSVNYGETSGFGWLSYMNQIYDGKWIDVGQSAPITPVSIRSLVCAPNHVRVWRRTFYNKIGGHNPKLNVADDMELMIRTCLYGKMSIIPELLYLQFRNYGGENFTFKRNAEIQHLVCELREYYNALLVERAKEFNIRDDIPQKFHWSHWSSRWLLPDALNHPRFDRVLGVDPRKITIIMPTYNRPELLQRAIDSVRSQTYQYWTLYIIGDHCPILERVMRQSKNMTDDRIQWHNMEKNYGPGGAVPRNYALYRSVTEWIAYLDDDNMWDPTHLQSLVDCLMTEPTASFVFSSMLVTSSTTTTALPIIAREPIRGRLDTSSVMHRRTLCEKHGMWKNRIDGGYAHDYELFSRLLSSDNEKWLCTEKCTNIYNCDTNGQTPESILNMVNDDQPEAHKILSTIFKSTKPETEPTHEHEFAFVPATDGLKQLNEFEQFNNVELKLSDIKINQSQLQEFLHTQQQATEEIKILAKNRKMKQEEENVNLLQSTDICVP